MAKAVNNELREYVWKHIVPMYDSFDSGHRRDHVQMVIDGSLKMAEEYDVNVDMLYAAAAYHDTGLIAGRETHHLESGRIIRSDISLRKWFSEEQIDTIACAAEDHRASSKDEPRSIYGRIVAEADRTIDPENIILRTVQYGLAHYPELDREGHWARTLDHLHEKYDYGGYLKLWIHNSPNAARLEELRTIIHDENRLRLIFDKLYNLEHQ